MEVEFKEMREEKERLVRERDELLRELKRFQYVMKNQKFDIVKFKDSFEDVEFYIGFFYWDVFMFFYDLVSQKVQNLNYGSYEKKDSGLE